MEGKELECEKWKIWLCKYELMSKQASKQVAAARRCIWKVSGSKTGFKVERREEKRREKEGVPLRVQLSDFDVRIRFL
jgi:hypothetical protein